MNKNKKFWNRKLTKSNDVSKSENEPTLDNTLSSEVVQSEVGVLQSKKGILATVLTHPIDKGFNEDMVPKFLIKDNSMETELTREYKANELLKEVPTLTDIVSLGNIDINEDFRRLEKLPESQMFSSSPQMKNVMTVWTKIEDKINDDLLYLYRNSKSIKEYKEFWLSLYHFKSQHLFTNDYYISWLLRWISNVEQEKIEVLCFSFIWRDILELNDDMIFELLKPTFHALKQFNEISLIFKLLESLLMADIVLPEIWLENYVSFSLQVNGSHKIEKSFNSILMENRNKNIKKRG